MVIKKILLKGFGKFNNKNFEFKDGLNIVYGKNEQGKTTMQKSIEGILYGFFIRGGKTKRYSAEYEKYKPWNSGIPYMGSMDIDINNSQYTLERNFQKNHDLVEIYDTITRQNLTSNFPENKILKLKDPADDLLGLSHTAFANTISISQLSSKIDNTSNKELGDKIANMSITNDEEISIATVISNLKEKEDEIGKTGRGKKLGEVNDFLKNLNEEYDNARKNEEQIELVKENIKSLKEYIKILNQEQEEIKYWLNICKYEEEKEKFIQLTSLKEKVLKNNDFIEQNSKINMLSIFDIDVINTKNQERNILEKTIDELQNEKKILIEKLDVEIDELRKSVDSLSVKNGQAKEKNNKLRINIMLGISITVFSIIVFAVLKKLFPLLGAIIGIFFIVLGLMNKKEIIEDSSLERETLILNEKIKQRAERVNEKDATIHSKLDEFGDLNSEISDMLYNIGANSLEGLEDIKNIKKQIENLKRDNQEFENRYKQILGDMDFSRLQEIISELPAPYYEINMNEKESKKIREAEVLQEITSKRIELNKNESDLESFERTSGNKDKLLKEIEIYEKEKDRYEEQLEVIRLVISKLEEVKMEIHKDLSPDINKNVSKIVSLMTSGKYDNVFIDKDFKICVEDKENSFYPLIDDLSSGTIDLIYLAFRIGLIDFLRGEQSEKLPIILDDSFSQFDDYRLRNALENFVCKLNRQVILFTCHTREKEALDRCDIKYNYIEI